MYIHEIVFLIFLQYCQSQGGFLVELNSQEETDIVFANKDLLGIIGNTFYLGLNRISDNWVWISGDPLDWTNWGQFEPNNNEDCAWVSSYSFEWSDSPCFTSYWDVLCEA